MNTNPDSTSAATAQPTPRHAPETPRPAASAELAEVLDDLSRAAAIERQQRELAAAARAPRGAD